MQVEVETKENEIVAVPKLLGSCSVQVKSNKIQGWTFQSPQHALVVRGHDGPHLFVIVPALPGVPQTVLADELMLARDEFDNAYALLTR